MDKKKLKKEYSNGDITVLWQSEKCIHSGNCVKNLAAVFQPQSSPWIQLENATTSEIIKAVDQCPSGALSYYKNKE
jgi:uncharacterized Fe-S cluster protein YjdI